MPLDPQVKIFLEEYAALGLPAYNELSPPEARKQMIDLAIPVDPLLAVKRVEDQKILGSDCEIPVRLYYPEGNPPFPVLIYPITDYNFDTPSYLKNADGYMLTRDLMQWFWKNYIKGDYRRTAKSSSISICTKYQARSI